MPQDKLPARLALSLLVPAAFFAALEGALTLAGVQPLSLTEDPMVGFAAGQPLFVEKDSAGQILMATNSVKLANFNPQSFPKKKPAGAYRIFTLGGSTAYGHPWNDTLSIAGWLREFLAAADPGRKWEVINAGGISYASYREARLVAELSAYEPDLFIVYSGHNEFLEERTYRETARIPAWAREAGALLDRTRTYSALRRLIRRVRKPAPAAAAQATLAGEVDEVLSRTIGPVSYVRDDSLRARVLEHYRLSLRRMARLAQAAGGQVLFLSTPGNEKDCSPFKSAPGPGLSAQALARKQAWATRAEALSSRGGSDAAPWDSALAAFDSALALDGRDADLLYRAGQAAFAAKRYPEAKRLFQQSLDEDICPLRALTAMRDQVRATAAEEKALFLDVTAWLEARSRQAAGHEILGEPDFVDHVHLDYGVYRALALAIVDELASRGVARPASDWGEAAMARVTAKVMSSVDNRMLGMGLHNIAKTLNWAGKHEDAARIAARGLEKDSLGLEAIWSSLFVGSALERQGKSEEALPHYRRAVRLDPDNPLSRRHLAGALMRSGQLPAAAEEYQSALRLDPGNPETQENLGKLLHQMGRLPEALQYLGMAAQGQPHKAELATTLGIALFQSGRSEEAQASFSRALQLNPRDPWAMLGLGYIAENRGDRGQAIDFFSRALSIHPGLREAREALSRNLADMTIP